MRKILVLLATIFAASMLLAGAAQAAGTVTWSPNDPVIEIYNEAMQVGYFTIDFDSITTEHISKTESIHLLLIDGGFVPTPGIIIANGRTLVPVDLVAETLGATADWDEEERLVTIKDGETEILLPIDSKTATVNGAGISLDVPAAIVSASPYVPLRFIAENLGATVDYIPQLTYGIDHPNDPIEYWIRARESVNVVVIEKGNKAEKEFTVEEGLAVAQAASQQLYEDLLGYLEVDGGRAISDYGRGDYDPQAIAYAGYAIGRYLVYQLEGFAEYPIFFNKYDGEMYSESVGLPFIFWMKGFPHLTFIYQ